jgi:hypothetical protein
MTGRCIKSVPFLLIGFFVGELVHLSLMEFGSNNMTKQTYKTTEFSEIKSSMAATPVAGARRRSTPNPQDKNHTLFELGCPRDKGYPTFNRGIADSIVSRLRDPVRCYCLMFGYYKRYKINFDSGDGWYPFMRMLERATYEDDMDLGSPPYSTPEAPVLYISVGNSEGHVLRFFETLKTNYLKRILAFEPNPKNHEPIEKVVDQLMSARVKKTGEH